MMAANIPWRCLNNDTFRNFLKKYTVQHIPHESTLRKGYLDDCYDSAIQAIRSDIGDNFVWISVDETTDSMGRQVANLIVGKLCDENTTKPHLLACKILEKTNNATIARFVNSGIKILWPNGNFEEKVLLLITDAAAYMLKAGMNLKVFYPNLIHLTCVVHGFNRVAEEIRLNFPLVNKLISSVKKVFLKAPLRIECYRSKLENVPLPPEPILTRWGTWLEAAHFYAIHLNSIKEIIESFDPEEAESIKKALEVLQNEQLVKDLTYIQTHFKILPTTMKELEAIGMPLTESVQIARSCINSLRETPGFCGSKIKMKIDNVLERNPGIREIFKLSKIIACKTTQPPEEIPSNLWSKYKFAPITSCDVERSFSAYKLILSDKRHQFTVSNLEKILVLYCHLNYNSDC